MDKISKVPAISAVHRTEGRYDLIIKISAETEDSLKEAVSMNINTIKGVDATLSLIIAS